MLYVLLTDPYNWLNNGILCTLDEVQYLFLNSLYLILMKIWCPIADQNKKLRVKKQIDQLLASRHLKLNVSFVPVMNMISILNCLFPQVLLLTIEIFLSQLLRRLVHAVSIFIWLHTNIPVTLMFM